MLRSFTLLTFWFWQADLQQEGIKALEQQEYSQAADLFRKAVAQDPKNFATHFHLGLALSLLNQDAEAISEYKKVLELDASVYEAQLNVGILLLRQKQLAEALGPLRTAADKKPKEFRPNYYLGEALLALGDPEAANAFKAALDADPKSASATVGLARAFAKSGRLSEAAPLYHKAVELDPGFQDLLLELADLHEKAKQPDEALTIYQKFPQLPGVQERMGSLLLEKGSPEQAVPILEQAVKSAPTSANKFALATAYIRIKQGEKAVPLLTSAANSEPKNWQLLMTLGRLLRDMKQYPNAANIFFRASQLQPQTKESWSELGGMLFLSENYPQALAAFDKLIELGSPSTGAYYFRAITLDHMHQYKLALPAYEKFLALSENKNPEEEFKSRQRIKVIVKELAKH